MSAYRVEPCVCGGVIRAPSLRTSGEYVRLHNMSLTHCVWRFGREGPTALASPRDLSEGGPRASVPLVRQVS